jgi:hypothetical protein
MTRLRIPLFILLLLLLGVLAGLAVPARAQSNLQVISNTASLTFPDSLDFQAEFQSASNITSAVLQYGVDQLTCGTVQAEAFPTFAPGTDVKVDWTWEMLQSGSLAPGSTVWWQWQVVDASGNQFTSPTKSILWLDNTHPWQVITGGNINLHYYDGGASFGQQLHDAAVKALTRLSQDVGVSTTSPVDIYIYANTSDLQSSILFAPSWAGGQAYPEDNIVIIGISPDQLTWGKSTEAHELTHVLVGHLTFSCLGFIPTWLDEGLAVYGEGGPQAGEQALFDQAKAAGQLPSLQSLAGRFSDEANRADVSYAEAYSVVNFMIKTYGRDKMTALLLDLRDGQTMDAALQAVYKFDTNGLEDAWRLSIGAAPLHGSSQLTPSPTPTVVPTFVPIGAAPPAAALVTTSQPTLALATATPLPTASAPTPTVVTPPSGINTGNLATILLIALACLVILVVLVVLVIVLLVRRQKRSGK